MNRKKKQPRAREPRTASPAPTNQRKMDPVSLRGVPTHLKESLRHEVLNMSQVCTATVDAHANTLVVVAAFGGLRGHALKVAVDGLQDRLFAKARSYRHESVRA